MRDFRLFVAALILGTVPAVACQGPELCTVKTPRGTPLPVRATVGGRISSTIENGQKVVVVDRVIKHGRLWARVARSEAESAGWILKSQARCEAVTSAHPSPGLCVLRNPTDAPLEVLDAPGGKIRGTFKKGERVRVFAERNHEGQAWIHVDRKEDDNVVGLAFDAYLRCERD